MYRILSASKDTYITNKYIAGSRSLDSNVGRAGTIDLFKLHNETSLAGVTSSIKELSRGLIQFDLDEIRDLTGSFLNVGDSSFKAILNLKDVYGGQTTPSNFILRVLPLSQSFDEGRGSDVVSYRDIDAANYVTASISNGTTNLWNEEGANGSGSLNDPNIDIIVSGNIGSGVQNLEATQTFLRGDEDMYVDVTSLVSASVVGLLPSHGWRISFSEAFENDSLTYFVKRFGSRHTSDKSLHPHLIVKFDDQQQDSMGNPKFDVSQSLFTYNIVNGNYRNFFSGSTEITGVNSVLVELVASKSITYTTSSWSISHSASITHLTKSTETFTKYLTGSQHTISGISQTGIYRVDMNLSSIEPVLRTYLSGAKQLEFRVNWKSLDDTLLYAHDYTTFEIPQGGFTNVDRRNMFVNITNLNEEYRRSDIARLRVFAQNFNTEVIATHVPKRTKPEILRDMRWRLRKAFENKVVIPFDSTTKLSYDRDGMYFDLYVEDLDVNEVYQIDFQIKSENNRDHYIENAGFRFKVIE